MTIQVKNSADGNLKNKDTSIVSKNDNGDGNGKDVEVNDDDQEDDQDEKEGGMVLPSELSSTIGTPIGDHGKSEDDQFNDDVKRRKLGDGKDVENSNVNDEEDTGKEGTSNPDAKPQATKMPTSVLERRRLGRKRAAAAYAIKLQKTGIDKKDNDNLQQAGLFRPILLVNQKNCSSDYLKSNNQIFALRDRKILRNTAATTSTTTAQSVSGTASNTPEVAELKSINNQSTTSLVDEAASKSFQENISLDDPTTTIVIHPGSKYLKIGFAKDESPLVIPNCVAFPKNSVYKENVNQIILNEKQSDKFNRMKQKIQQSFRDRMRYYKRKVQSNSYERVTTFNAQSKPEKIEDRNDHSRVEWITNPDKVYYGDEAERCSKDSFIVRYPFTRGGAFNTSSPYYNSVPEIIGDMCNLIEYALGQERFNVKPNQYSQYKVILVIPDIFEKSHVEAMLRVLLKEMDFQAAALMQESLAASYGAGIGGATCIVNIGATQIRIACIDEGTVAEHSLITLDYGGDDITKLFALLLLQSKFPYQDLDINSSHGWRLVENLKKQFTTFEDANITVQLYNFIKHKPGFQAEKLEFKVFDEVINAPLGLFFPEIFKILSEENEKKTINTELLEQLPSSRDLYTEEKNDWRSLAQYQCLESDTYAGNEDDLDILTKLVNANLNLDEADLLNEDAVANQGNYTPLDKAIIQSITNAVVTMDTSKMSQFYNNIMVVGGSSSIPSLDFILTDRINIWRPRILGASSFPGFFRNLVKQVKELNSSIKSNSKPEEEDHAKESITQLINGELNKFKEGIESQSNNEHLLPVSVLPPPSDMDPSVLNWKGASVLGQIKLVEELYITNTDWDMLGSRILQYKCLFPY